jgi:hypothetical protein
MVPTPWRVAAAMIAAFLAGGCSLWGTPGTDDSTSKDDKTPGLPIRGDLSEGWFASMPHAVWADEGAAKAPGHRKKEQQVFRTKVELLKVWTADGGTDMDFPSYAPGDDLTGWRAVDFDKEMVVGVFAGRIQNHSGIRIERVLPKGNGLVVEFRGYGWNSGVAPPIRCPCHVVVVDKVEGSVEFKELPSDIPPFEAVP